MSDGVPSHPSGDPWWRSRPAIALWVGLAVVLVGSSVWSARAGSGGSAAPGPSGSGAAPSASGAGPGTPKITISFTPSWTSATSPVVAGSAQLRAQPGAAVGPVLLAMSDQAPDDLARLDPGDGRWLWSTSTGQQPWVGWAGAVALFSGSLFEPELGDRPPTNGLSPAGRVVFTTRAGGFVTSTDDRVLLAYGRSLTALNALGKVVWRATLPAGVTRPGRVTAGASAAVFSSTHGAGRVTVVDLAGGALRTFPIASERPYAWVTPTGVAVADGATAGSLAFYDLTGQLQWSTAGKVHVDDISAGHALVTDPGTASPRLLDLEHGATVWTPLHQDHPFLTGTLTSTANGTVVVVGTITAASGEAVPTVIGIDPLTGEQRWENEGKAYVGTWHDFVLLSDSHGAVLSAISAKDGIADATLNVGVPLSSNDSAVVGDTLIYLDTDAGTAHALGMTDHP